MTTGWLSQEVFQALEHAGYVAVPKECVETLYAEDTYDLMDLAHPELKKEIELAKMKRMAQLISMELLRKGFIDVQLYSPGKNDFQIKHRAYLSVIRPRVIKPESSK